MRNEKQVAENAKRIQEGLAEKLRLKADRKAKAYQEPTNADRAQRAEKALLAYGGKRARLWLKEEGLLAITDLLVDLHHYVAANHKALGVMPNRNAPIVALADALGSAERHYMAETDCAAPDGPCGCAKCADIESGVMAEGGA